MDLTLPTQGWGVEPIRTKIRLSGSAFSLVPYMHACIQAVELRSSGREPYAYRFARTHMAAELQRRFQDLPAGEVADLQVLAAPAGYTCTLISNTHLPSPVHLLNDPAGVMCKCVLCALTPSQVPWDSVYQALCALH